MNLELVGLSTALGVALLASITDIRERRIPNTLVVAGLIAAGALAVVGGRWVDALTGGGLGMALLALPRLVAPEAVGFGDIKLVGIAGLAAGLPGVIAVVGIAVVAAVVAFAVRAACRRMPPEGGLPFAPYLAMGVVGYLAIAILVSGN